LVAIGRVFNVVINPLNDVGAILDGLKNILPVSAAIIGLYVLFAYPGKRKMDKEMSSSRALVTVGQIPAPIRSASRGKPPNLHETAAEFIPANLRFVGTLPIEL